MALSLDLPPADNASHEVASGATQRFGTLPRTLHLHQTSVSASDEVKFLKQGNESLSVDQFYGWYSVSDRGGGMSMSSAKPLFVGSIPTGASLCRNDFRSPGRNLGHINRASGGFVRSFAQNGP